VTNLDFNIVPPGGPFLSIFDRTSSFGGFAEGNYGLAMSSLTGGVCSLVQQGDFPADARLLSYKYLGGPFALEVNGRILIPLNGPLQSATEPRFPTFDVSAFAGQSAEVRFTLTNGQLGLIDSIVFQKESATDIWFERDTAGAQNSLFGIGSNSNSLVVVGSRGTILTSHDGQRWLQQTSPTTNDLLGVAVGNGVWVAVGANGTILTSTDAQQWRLSNTITNTDFNAVTYALGLFAAVGGQASTLYGTQDAVWTSPSGIAWTDRSLASAPGVNFAVQRSVIYTPEKQAFVSVGEGTVLVSNSGEKWDSLYPSATNVTPLANSVAYGGGQFISVGESGIYSSTNAADWVRVSSGAGPENYSLYSITYFESAFWAVGTTPGTNGIAIGAILHSTDGQTWRSVEGLHAPGLLAVSPVGSSLLAVGETGTILQSASALTPPRFRAWATQFLPDGSLDLILDAPPGKALSIEFSSGLKIWSLLQTVTNTTTRVEITDAGAEAAVNRLYRAKAE
jgi:hypothetical protein